MSAKTQHSNNGQLPGRYLCLICHHCSGRANPLTKTAEVSNSGNSFLERFWMEMVVALRSLFKGLGIQDPR